MMMNKIKKQFKFPKVYNFYLEILKKMLEAKPLPWETVYSCGGKGSGKTYCVCLLISYCFYYDISAIFLVFRKETQNLPKTIQEVLDRLDAAGFVYKHNKSRNIILSDTGKTKVQFYSLFNPKSSKVQQLGLTGNSRYTYEIG